MTLKYETPRPTPAVQAPNAAGGDIPGKNPGCRKSYQNNTHNVTLCLYLIKVYSSRDFFLFSGFFCFYFCFLLLYLVVFPFEFFPYVLLDLLPIKLAAQWTPLTSHPIGSKNCRAITWKASPTRQAPWNLQDNEINKWAPPSQSCNLRHHMAGAPTSVLHDHTFTVVKYAVPSEE